MHPSRTHKDQPLAVSCSLGPGDPSLVFSLNSQHDSQKMKSYSRNHLRPAFNHLATEARLAASLGSDNPPSAEQLQLWSYQLPTLSAGSYAVSVSQEITLPSGETVHLDQTTKDLHVPLPKFRLPDPSDLYSVHPAPGHSAHARTLYKSEGSGNRTLGSGT